MHESVLDRAFDFLLVIGIFVGKAGLSLAGF